jgi:hypothetical protein
MSTPLLRAQSLDNRSPDLFAVGRSLVDIDDGEKRELVASKISEITGARSPDYDGPFVKVWWRKDNVVGRILCDEKDEAGRGAPIVCYLEARDEQDAGAAIRDAVAWFAGAIERKLSNHHLDELRTTVDHGRAKKKTQQILLAISIIILIGLATWATLRQR